MKNLSRSTLRRLKKLPQTPSVWEGDRRILNRFGAGSIADKGIEGECAIWVDGTKGFVRAMEVISPEMGSEALVRALITAMESPHSPAQPCIPKKIVVKNREIQFFLRGALQGLGINIDYAPQLPLIDELFRSFEEMSLERPPELPDDYEAPLQDIAAKIWRAAPWDLFADHDIIEIEIELEEPITVYACIMGMLGEEYGLILYRSLESLKQFRLAAINEKSRDKMENAFLAQDCWFVNYEAAPDEDSWEDEPLVDLSTVPDEDIFALFGSIHPYEGIRPFLDDDESMIIYLALQGFLKFFVKHKSSFTEEEKASLSKRYQLTAVGDDATKISVTVSTQPELSMELLSMADLPSMMPQQPTFTLQNDLVPDKSFLSLGMIPWEVIEDLKIHSKTYYQSQNVKERGEGMPILLIQTSRPKAQVMIDKLQAAGGLEAFCFNPGEDPVSGIEYDLGILQTGNGSFYLCGEFLGDDPNHIQAKKKWKNRCKSTKGYCGLVVAKGVTGAAKGNPSFKDMMAFFETKALNAKDLDMGVLQLLPYGLDRGFPGSFK